MDDNKALIKNIILKNANLKFDRPFDANRIEYSIDVDESIDTLEMQYIKGKPGTTVSIEGDTQLKNGLNVIKIIATNDNETVQYIFYVNKKNTANKTTSSSSSTGGSSGGGGTNTSNAASRSQNSGYNEAINPVSKTSNNAPTINPIARPNQSNASEESLSYDDKIQNQLDNLSKDIKEVQSKGSIYESKANIPAKLGDHQNANVSTYNKVNSLLGLETKATQSVIDAINALDNDSSSYTEALNDGSVLSKIPDITKITLPDNSLDGCFGLSFPETNSIEALGKVGKITLSDINNCLSGNSLVGPLHENFESIRSSALNQLGLVNGLAQSIANNPIVKSDQVWNEVLNKYGAYGTLLKQQYDAANILENAYIKALNVINTYLDGESLDDSQLDKFKLNLEEAEKIKADLESQLAQKKTVNDYDSKGNYIGSHEEDAIQGEERAIKEEQIKNADEIITECKRIIKKLEGLPDKMQEAEKIINDAQNEVNGAFKGAISNFNNPSSVAYQNYIDSLDAETKDHFPKTLGNNEKLEKFVLPQTSSPNIQPKNNNNIAHRGYSATGWGDNSVRAFTEAGENGYWGVEVDVRFDSNGNLICSHNAPKKGENPPSFDEYLDVCKKYGMTGIVDFKYEHYGQADPALAAAVTKAIRDKGMTDSMILQTNNYNDIPALREADPDARIWCLVNRGFDTTMDVIKQNNVEGVNLNNNSFSYADVKKYANAGLDVCVYNVSSVNQKNILIKNGGKWIMTDYDLDTSPYQEGDYDYNAEDSKGE